MSDKPDFEALRQARNANLREMIRDICGQDAVHIHGFDPNACYCNCPEGPCEHDFQGWREFPDGNGGEQFCARCGAGAMSHSMRTLP